MHRCDPESSWSNTTSMISSTDIHKLELETEYIGFVPILAKLDDADETKRIKIVRSCLKTVVEYKPMDQFPTLIQNNKVGAFVRLRPLTTVLLIMKNLITIFYIKGTTTKVIGRYAISSLCCYEFEKHGDHIYFGFLASSNDKCECNVLKLSVPKQKDHIESYLKKLTSEPSMQLSIDARMRSAQDFKLTREMSLFFHGKIDSFAELMPNYGDFLFRESRATPEGTNNIFLTYRNMKKPKMIDCRVPAITTEEMFHFLRRYQETQFEQFRNPIPCFK